MTAQNAGESTIKPTDLRGILKYVPMFRDHVFVIALDGSLVVHENFQNVLLDIAVLRSLNIKVVLVHGVGQQLNALADERQIAITNAHGEGKTDVQTLELATEVSAYLLEYMHRELNDIVTALAQRRHVDRKNPEPVIQILAKFTGLDGYKKVLETDCDLIVTATPPHFRSIHVLAAIKAGKNVFAEKWNHHFIADSSRINDEAAGPAFFEGSL